MMTNLNESNKKAKYTQELSDDVMQNASLDGIAEGLGCTRRDLINATTKMFGAAAFAKLLVACRTVSGSHARIKSGNSTTFMADILAAEAATPVVDPTDRAAVGARMKAVGGTIGKWLNKDPYGLIDELLGQSDPIFKRDFGAAIIFRHAHVIEALRSPEQLTVGMYTREMQRATDGEFNAVNNTNFPNYYMLGTDDTNEYDGDARILRAVVVPADKTNLRKIIRESVTRRLKEAVAKSANQGNVIDMVQTIARYVPVDVVGEYLGVPSFVAGEKCFDGQVQQQGGLPLALDSKMTNTFKITTMTQSKIPEPSDMYYWVRDAFRNIFNNVGRRQDFGDAGLKATEGLSAYIHYVIQFYKPLVQAGKILGQDIPDTMLTRLLKLQWEVEQNRIQPSDFGFASLNEMKDRLTDARIRSNVFGTVVGAVANPEEANARIIHGALKFKDNAIDSVAGNPTYSDYVQWAASGNMDEINRLALELLRIAPQGETLLRKCVKPISIAGVTINPAANPVVFVMHAAAMRDTTVAELADPLKINTKRDPKPEKYSMQGDPRANEEPQSTIYLQHGFGRHKCLGRYASEITMEEVLRGVLMLKNPRLKDELKMDSDGLYAVELLVEVDP